MKASPQIYFWHGSDDFAMHHELQRWLTAFAKKHTELNIKVLDPEDTTPFATQIVQIRQLLQAKSLFGSTKLLIFKKAFSTASW